MLYHFREFTLRREITIQKEQENSIRRNQWTSNSMKKKTRNKKQRQKKQNETVYLKIEDMKD